MKCAFPPIEIASLKIWPSSPLYVSTMMGRRPIGTSGPETDRFLAESANATGSFSLLRLEMNSPSVWLYSSFPSSSNLSFYFDTSCTWKRICRLLLFSFITSPKVYIFIYSICFLFWTKLPHQIRNSCRGPNQDIQLWIVWGGNFWSNRSQDSERHDGELELWWRTLTVYLELRPENSQDTSRATSWPHGWDATINSEDPSCSSRFYLVHSVIINIIQ